MVNSDKPDHVVELPTIKKNHTQIPNAFMDGGSKTQVTGHCFTNTGITSNLYLVVLV